MKHNVYTFQFVQTIIILAFAFFGIKKYVNTDPMAVFWLLVIGIASAFAVTEAFSRLPSSNVVYKIMFKEW